MSKTGIKVRISTQIRDAKTDRIIKRSKARENLVFDGTLTALALGAQTFSSVFLACKIGSSSAANFTPSNTITFTQAGNTITASAAFFAVSMVGNLFKYGLGTGGAEQYIASIGGGGLTATVVGAGMTVSTPTVATVWYVTQTQLTTPLTALIGGCASTTYVTSPGACGFSFPGGASSTTIQLQRTFRYPVQTAPYSVQEIGYSYENSNAGLCSGRLVLLLPDTVGITQYYVVQISITYSATPNTPTAQSNVGTGINTAGQVMWNFWDCYTVNSDGSVGNSTGAAGANTMDGGPPQIALVTSGAPTLNTSISQAASSAVAIGFGSADGSAYTNTGLGVGIAQTTTSFSFVTTGQTVYAIYFVSGSGGNTSYAAPIFCLLLTTPFTLPNGTFQGNFVWQRQYTRTLSN